MDIADASGNPMVGSIPLVTGADLLEQYAYLGFGGALLVVTTQGPPDTVPGFGDLGVTSSVFFLPYAPPVEGGGGGSNIFILDESLLDGGDVLA